MGLRACGVAEFLVIAPRVAVAGRTDKIANGRAKPSNVHLSQNGIMARLIPALDEGKRRVACPPVSVSWHSFVRERCWGLQVVARPRCGGLATASACFCACASAQAHKRACHRSEWRQLTGTTYGMQPARRLPSNRARPGMHALTATRTVDEPFALRKQSRHTVRGADMCWGDMHVACAP